MYRCGCPGGAWVYLKQNYLNHILARIEADNAGADLRWREATLSPYDLYTAGECFLTGTGAGLIPVREVDGRPLRHCPGPLYARLCAGFAKLIERETA